MGFDGVASEMVNTGMTYAGAFVDDYWPLFALLAVVGVVSLIVAIMQRLG